MTNLIANSIAHKSATSYRYSTSIAIALRRKISLLAQLQTRRSHGLCLSAGKEETVASSSSPAKRTK